MQSKKVLEPEVEGNPPWQETQQNAEQHQLE